MIRHTIFIFILLVSTYVTEITARTTLCNKDSLKHDTTKLAEVIVTAKESKGLATASIIGKQAMTHLQPSSFSDILELLPGGRFYNPQLSTPNTIHLREALPYNSINYSTTSLGTSFLIDGIPISTNANMQALAGSWELTATSRSSVNRGVDMRNIPTDDIEKIEIIRGVPSVEYGDLTSGLIKIQRKLGGHNLTARVKADMNSKLLYIAKSMEWKNKSRLNLSIDYLNSNSDPRNSLESYSRLSLSLRSGIKWTLLGYNMQWKSNFDYSGSLDAEKLDPDLNSGKIDSYKSSYNRISIGSILNIINKKNKWLKEINATASSSLQMDFMSRTKLIQLQRATPSIGNSREIEYDVPLLPYTYYATQDVDGKPFNLFLKINALVKIPSSSIFNTLLIGASYNIDKNYGKGQIFDFMRPLYPNISIRPRLLYKIPSINSLSAYAEERIKIDVGKSKIETIAGVRFGKLCNLSKNYLLNNQWTIDPRINIGWTLPKINILQKKMSLRLIAGIGKHTKYPTLCQLYPDPIYLDITQLNYYNTDLKLKKMNIRTYIINPTNYNINVAKNIKWELTSDINFDGNNLSITFFKEVMNSGFRLTSVYHPYKFKIYDISNINSLIFNYEQELFPHTITTNGSTTNKQGIEYTLISKRIKSLHTRITINGAWFKTIYRNSQATTYRPQEVINNKQIQYIGLYKDNDGVKNEMSNTNFMIDSNIPNIQLGVSISAQCLWYTSTQRLPLSKEPEQYIDFNGKIHNWQQVDKYDTNLRFLVRSHSAQEFIKYTVPFSMNINLKITKSLLNDKINVAMYCNRLLDYTPNYKQNNITIRRFVRPYFGLEINMKL